MTPKASARSFRPKRFSDVVGQAAVVTTLQNAIVANAPAQAYLFCGPRGTGKTTLARLVAEALNCESRTGCEPCGLCRSCMDIAASRSMDVIEIDGASHRGIDEIRKINETANYTPSPGKTKVYIIDEVHMLTKEAFNALLKTLEEPPAHVMFIFATTEPQKLPATIVSRCQRFFLERIETSLIKQTLEKLCGQIEAFSASLPPLDSLALIATAAEGGMRDALSLFDQACAFDPLLSLESVQKALGIASEAHLFALDEAKKKGQLGFAFELAHSLLQSGQSAKSFLEALLQHLRALMLVYTGSDFSLYLQDKKEHLDAFKASAKIYTQSECLSLIDFVIDALVRLPQVLSERMLLETVLLKVIGSSDTPSTPRAVQKVETVEAPLKEEVAQTESIQSLPDTQNNKKPEPTQAPEQPNSSDANSQQDLRSPQLKAKHDSLIRFAAVELEATLQTRTS